MKIGSTNFCIIPKNPYFFLRLRKEYDCVMQFMLEEHGTQAAGNPVYIGLEADIADYRRNIFKWASPMCKQ